MEKLIEDKPSVWYVYLTRCADDSLYCGISKNVDKRIDDHNAGRGSKYTRSRLPVEYIIKMGPMTKSMALKCELEIKKLERNQKIAYFIFNSYKYDVSLRF